MANQLEEELFRGMISAPDYSGPQKISEVFAALVGRVEKLEHAENELGNIRATLLLNFGEGRNKYGFAIKDEGSVTRLLWEVLEHLVTREK